MVNAVSRIVTLAYVGLLTLLACLPLVSAFAALRAASIVLADPDQTGISSTFWEEFRSQLRLSGLVQLLWTAAVTLAIFDIVLAIIAVSPMRSAVAVAGAIVLVTAVALLPYLIVSCRPGLGVRQVFRGAVVRAGQQPAVTAATTVITVLIAGMAVVLPYGIPVYVGGWAALCIAVGRRAENAVTRRTGLEVGGIV